MNRRRAAIYLRVLSYTLLVGVAVMVLLAGSRPAELTYQPDPEEVATDVLIAANACWVGGTGHPIPGHAVVDTGAGPELTTSDVGFHIMLDGAPGVLYAFCP